MKALFLFIASLGFISSFAQLQPVQLQLKKNGKVKKRLFIGTEVLVKTEAKEQVIGIMTGMKDSILFINGRIIPVNKIRKLQLVYPKPHQKINGELVAYTSLGVAVSTIGMTLSKWEKLGSAILISATIGYSPFLIKAIAGKLKRLLSKKHSFRIGGRFSLRIWDIN